VIPRRLLIFVIGALIVAGALVGALLATGRSPASQSPPELGGGPYRGSEPPTGIRIPNVSLPSYRGEVVSLRGQRGKVVVLTFLDSKCTDTCPIIAAVIGRAWPLLTATERMQIRAYAISVNPLVDKPQSVRRFLAARHAVAALDWLVAPVEEMRPVWHDFGVLPATETGNNDLHSADVRVFDRRGTWVSTLHAGVDLTPSNLVHDIRLALRVGS
jgi:cytochrome oxidase Cu insertion factor (SCO1/SenC/PrrC family)